MRFDIDSTRAKSMAGRLQAFLTETPKTKLTRSSAIEAVAQLLGFNNRNEMLARLDATEPTPQNTTHGAAQATATDPGSRDLRAEADAVRERLYALYLNLIERCAQNLVEEARRIAPETDDFRAAIHAEDADGTYALLTTEEIWSQELGHHTLYPIAIETFSDEVESARDVRQRVRDAVALALVNESLERAEDLWSRTREGDVRKQSPQTFDVDVSCWAPGSLRVELPGEKVGEIDAEVLCMAVIQVDADNGDDALVRAQDRLETETFAMIWNPRPDRGVRNARWTSDGRGEDLETYLAREDLLVEDHWEVDTGRATTFRADQVVDRD